MITTHAKKFDFRLAKDCHCKFLHLLLLELEPVFEAIVGSANIHFMVHIIVFNITGKKMFS